MGVEGRGLKRCWSCKNSGVWFAKANMCSGGGCNDSGGVLVVVVVIFLYSTDGSAASEVVKGEANELLLVSVLNYR